MNSYRKDGYKTRSVNLNKTVCFFQNISVDFYIKILTIMMLLKTQ